MSTRNISPEERYHLRVLRDRHFEDQGGLCYFCKMPMTPADAPSPQPPTTCTIEHLKPRHRGGGSNYLNTAASCLKCNNGRVTKSFVQGRDVPRVTLEKKARETKVLERGRKVPKRIVTTTYSYTVPSAPNVLVLANHNLNRDDALMEIKKAEGQPVTLKGHAHIIE